MNWVRHMALKWGLSLVYVAVILTLIYLFPAFLQPLLLVVYVIYAVWSYFNSEATASRQMNLRPFTPWDTPNYDGLMKRLRTVALGAGLRREPWYAVLESRALNAMAVGGRRGVVVFTTGLLERLTEDELVAVFAHEIQHLRARDALPATIGCAWLGMIGGIVNLLYRIADTGAGILAGLAGLFGVVLYAGLRAVAWLGNVSLARRSRYDEEMADLAGARVTSAAVMIAALERLQAAQPAQKSAYAPWSAAWITEHLHASHPPTDLRVKYLTAAAQRGEICAQ